MRIRKDCLHYHEEPYMGARVDCCLAETAFGMCPCTPDCENYIPKNSSVVHAYWIDTDNYYRRWRCSACSGHTKEAHPPFCPFCGAKMDGERKE